MRQNKKAVPVIANDNGGQSVVVVDFVSGGKTGISRMRRAYIFTVDFFIMSIALFVCAVAFITYLGVAGKRLDMTMEDNSPVFAFRETGAVQPVELYPSDGISIQLQDLGLPEGGK